MTKRKRRNVEACVLAILGGSAISCLVLSGDFNLRITEVYQEHYGTITPMILEFLGIVLVVGLVVWLARRHPKFPTQFERTGWLWLWALNGIIYALLGGTILYLFVLLYWKIWGTSENVLQDDTEQFLLPLLGLKELGFLLFASFCIVTSGFSWRNFINTWRTSKVKEYPKTGTSGFGN